MNQSARIGSASGSRDGATTAMPTTMIAAVIGAPAILRNRSADDFSIRDARSDVLISVDEEGKQHYLDVHIAYRQACLNAIEYLKKFGYSGAQAYSILGTAPCQGHISGVVDVPNACATLWLPTEIFDFDIMPSSVGPIKHIKGDIQMPLSPDK